MTREDAKQLLAQARLPLLDEEDREGLIMEWTVFEEEDNELDLIPADLRDALLSGEEIEDAALPKYDPLVLLAIKQELRGVRNEYLRDQLTALGLDAGEVTGEVELLEICPCCGFRTLEYRQNFEICAVCYWADDDTIAEDDYSDENEMTLSQARENFARIGISDDGILEFRLEEPEKVYLKA